jgi:hypothetical protein
MKSLLLTLALFMATVYGANCVMARWPDDAAAPWVFGIGLAVVILGSVAVKMSGIERLYRALRDALIGAWVGEALRKTGLYGPRVAGTLRFFGYDTDPAHPDRLPQTRSRLSWSNVNDAVLLLGWIGSVIGLALIWAAI